MSGGPSQSSRGAPFLQYSSPNPPRRSSYASVAAGITGGSSGALDIPDRHQYSRIPRLISAEAEMAGQGGTRIPETWGSGTREAHSNPSISTFTKHVSSPWDSLLRGANPDGFFKPTYLIGTQYMEDLEAAHRASLEEKAEAENKGPGYGTLSKKSSSADFGRMQGTHRGMSYQVIERPPTVMDNGPAKLPSRWEHTDKYNCVEIGADGQQLRYAGTSKVHDLEATAARADRPMPTEAGIYYYEVTILSKGKDGIIGVGFSGNKVSLEKLPGWEPDSWAYHGDDGKTYSCQSPAKDFGPKFGSDDTVGCGVNFTNGTGFFTLNGNFVGAPFRELKGSGALYPSVGMKRPHAQVIANFGQRPFIFDIDTYVEQEKQKIRDEIQAVNISCLHRSLDKDGLCKALVAQYLSHDGYVDTAKAFAQETRQETTALMGRPDSSLDEYLTVEEDRDAANRQLIRAAVLDGNIDRALSLTTTFFPSVLATNHEINFRVRCRKYIEMIRQTAQLLDNPPSPSNPTSTSHNGHPQPASSEAMDLDDPPFPVEGDGQDGLANDAMETSAPGLPSYEDLISRAIAYGRELNTEFNDHPEPKLKETFSETMKELFGMLAYKDPRQSPAKRWLEDSERAKVAEGLNSAILVSLGKSPSTAMERCYRQTVVFADMMSDGGGPGSLINFRGILRAREGTR